jgi:large subunit ribosomal protein L4
MATAVIYQKDGSKQGEIELNPELFGARVNERLLALVLKAFAGNQRRGTHDTKERAEVRGGGKKPWKQKGTGRARQGSRRAPQWRGGGTVFGPTPHDYDTKLPTGMKNKAIISALSQKNQEGNLMFLEDAKLTEPKTKELVSVIKALGLDKGRTLFVVSAIDKNLERASKNVREVFSVRLARDVNAYHIQRRKKLLIEKEAVSILEKRVLSDEPKAKSKEGASV